MSNNYVPDLSQLAPGQQAQSSQINDRYENIVSGFDKLPAPAVGKVGFSAPCPVGAPIATDDATTKNYVDTSMTSQVNQAASSAGEAVVSAAAAEVSRLAAEAAIGEADTLGGQSSAYHLARENHTGAQAQSTITGLVAGLAGKLAVGAKAADSQMVDGINGSSLLRSDINTSASGRIDFTATPHVGGIADATGGLGSLEASGDATRAAMMSFHRGGTYASYFGLDTDNQWKVGGWSAGAVAHKLWHEGNDGTDSGLDADKLDGYHESSFARRNNLYHSKYYAQYDFDDGYGSSNYIRSYLRDGKLLWNGYGNAANFDMFIHGNKIWHAGNDGANSGLDADKLAGIDSTSFARTDMVESFNTSIGVGTTPGGSWINGKNLAIGDADTGIRQNGDGRLEIFTNNQEVARLQSNFIDLFRSTKVSGPLQVTGDITGRNNKPVPVRYTSGEITISSGGLATLTHGLPSRPTSLALMLRCKIAQHGYSVGDEVSIGSGFSGSAGANKSNPLYTDNTTQVKLRFDNASNSFMYGNETNGSNVTLTNANWCAIVTAMT